MNDLPGFIPPRVGFLQKKVAVHTDAKHFSAFHLVLPAALFTQRITEAGLCAVYFCAVLAAYCVVIVHIAVLAAFAALDAAVPWIPNIMQ